MVLCDLSNSYFQRLQKSTGLLSDEGVFREVELLADRTLISLKKAFNKDKDLSDASSAPDLPPPPILVSPAVAAGIPGYKKLSSLSLDPEDTVTLRAHDIHFQYLTGKESTNADNVFAMLGRLVERISDACDGEKEVGSALKEFATLFMSAHTSVSSFESLQSGVIDALLQFAMDKTRGSKWSLIRFVKPLLMFT